MICRFSVENFKAFDERVELDFYASLNIKRFGYNFTNIGGYNILKTTGIYGPNNTGKTCILLALFNLRALMLNEPHGKMQNDFANKGSITSFSVDYIVDDRFYSYSVSYDNNTRLYVSESLSLTKDHNNTKIFERDEKKLFWYGLNESYKRIDLSNLFSLSFPLMAVFNVDSNDVIKQARDDYFKFAESIMFLRMDRPVDISKTLSLIQTNNHASKFVKEFVKNCDLHVDDFGFDENVNSDTNIEEELKAALNNQRFLKETLKIYSKHNGYKVPSVFYDSTGTQKLIALAGYIYEAIHDGKVLIVDEIDSSLHHILTKAIVAMFNNQLNTKAQLVFSTHDALLLDLRHMFRKDQVWFVNMLNQSSSSLIRMSKEFTARDEDGIRGNENVTDYYLKGRFGAIPTPDLFSALEEAVSNE